MKRLSLRISVYVAAAALSCTPFMAVQAESHKPFYSRLNPKTWFKKSEPEGRAKVVDEQPKIVPGATSASVRSHLTEDPFALPANESAKSPSSVDKPRTQTADVARPQIAPSLSQRPAVNDSNDEFEEFGSGTKTTPKTSGSPSARKPSSTSTAKAGVNQFEEGFDADIDALVKSAKRETASAAPALPDLPTMTRSTPKTTPKVERELSLVEEASDSADAVREAAKGSLSDFEQFVAERAQAAEAAPQEAPKAERPVAKTTTTPLAKPKRQLLDLDSNADSLDGETTALEPREVVAQSRREIERSPIRTGFAQDVAASTRTESDRSTLTQTSGTAGRQDPSSVSAPRSRTNQLPEVRSSLSARDDLPLIVPNDQVPDRKLYVASQTYRTQSAATATQAASAETNAASLSHPTLPAVSAAPRANAHEEITPRASANRAPALTLPEPSKVRQLAFEDQTPEPRLPLLSIGGNAAPSEAGAGPLLFPSNALDGDAKSETTKAEVTSRERAPTIDWPDASDTVAPAKKKSSALMMLLAIVGVGLGIGYVIRRKAALATTGGTAVGDSPELGS